MAKTVTWILGIVFILVGVAGFFMDPLLVFEVDPIHNIIHLLSGVIALAAASSGESTSRMYLIIFGLVYLLVTIVGFVQGDTVLGLISVNQADNWLHLAISVLALAVGFTSKKQ